LPTSPLKITSATSNRTDIPTLALLGTFVLRAPFDDSRVGFGAVFGGGRDFSEPEREFRTPSSVSSRTTLQMNENL